MSAKTKPLLLNQDELLKLLSKAYSNYCKSPKARITSSYIETRTETLESLWAKFKDHHGKIVSVTDKDEQAELSYFTEDIYEQFEEMYIDYKSKMKEDLKECLASTSSSSNPQTATAATSCEVRLPQINLPRFSGGYEEWQSFHDMFLSLIHNNASLSAVQKLHYLKSCLHGEAEYVLKNLSTTETNYSEAWLQLTRRYNNKRFNTNEVLKRLFAQKTINSESSNAIKQLLDTTSACLKSLANLKIETSSWDDIVNHIVVSRLDQESRKQWELQLSQTESDELPSWEQLKKFMETRFRTMEMLEGTKSTTRSKTFHSSVEDKKNIIVCVMCNGPHALYQCKQFVKYTPKKRAEYVQNKGLCFNCLAPSHAVRRCHQSTSCRRCGRRHHSLLHIEREREKEETQGFTKGETGDSQPHTQPRDKTTIVSNFSKEFSPCDVLLATAEVRAKSVDGPLHVIRALIDQGSQASFITEETVQLLGLRRKPINGFVSGVGDGHTRVRYVVSLRIESRHHPGKSISVNAYVLSSLTSMLPSKVVHSPDWLELERLPLADPGFTSPNKIDILLGAEVYGEIIRSGVIKNPSRNLIAQNTVLGWIISGKVSPDSTSARRVISMHTQIREDDLLKQFWELEKEPDTTTKILTKDEMRCEEIFESTTTRDEDGRFIVSLPFNSDDPECQYGQMLQIAKGRLISLERRLAKNPKLHEEYTKVMNDYKDLHHMKPVPKEEIDNPKAVYLPHHAVVREDKDTTKVRVVFDASCKGENDVSLNDNLLVGPKLQQDLQHLLLRWRVHRICIIADLVKMYRQVCVNEKHIDYQRILWRPSPDQPIEHYQLLRLTFGTACAPYLAVKTLHKLAEEEKQLCPIAARITQSDMYIDDLMTGCENETEAIQIVEELNKLMKLGGFQFQKWSSNSNELLEYIGQNKREDESVKIKTDKTLKILGLTWNRADDSFEYEIKLPPLVTPVTKRNVVSDIARLFDPLGLVAPTITTAKVFIQKLWLSGIEWDQELPEPLLQDWITYREELHELSAFCVPRWIGTCKSDRRFELQGFCDASCVAYAAVVYARVIDGQGEVRVNLIRSKTKVAPVKQVSIPRLELCGAVLLARLLLDVSQVLQVSKENVHAWTDSTVVLAWLSSHPSKWKTFVANRVSEILTIMDSSQWAHVRSDDNPADSASRGIKAEELVGLELWKKGPSWLKDRDIKYSKGEFQKTTLEEKKSETVCVVANIIEKEELEEFIERFSSLAKMIRVGSYCRRVLNLKIPRNERQRMPEFVTVKEMDDTLQKLIEVVQSVKFREEIENIRSRGSVLKKSPLHTLCPILDYNGILRVGGRLDRAELSYDRKHPMILPDKSHLTKLIILDAHIKTLHGGPQIMMNHIRYKYFIIRARVQIKKYYRSCVTCRRFSSANRTQLMGQIPEVRLKPSKPFKSTGVDYAGPINIRFSPGRGSKAYKGYICLFVCMVTRAVHLEAVSDLTAKGFIAAFRRFTSRRGHCKDLFSDNGTNFVGSNKQLIEMFESAKTAWPEEIVQLLTLESTTWHFIPPHSPNFGGLWEAGVRSVKNHLKKVIGDSTLTYEELTTVLTQIEACLNSRPISVLSDDPCDPLPLTPGHFLVGEPLLNITDEDHCNKSVGLDRWRHCQRMVCSFWKRWSKEYIVNLNQRYKWNQKIDEPKINDVVVIREDNIPPTKWLLGKIIERYPGQDNITRVVKIQTKNGILKRTVSKVRVLTK